MGQHRLIGHVPDRENSVDAGPLLAVHANKSALIGLHARVFKTQTGSSRSTADRRQNPLENPRLPPAVRTFYHDPQAVLLGLHFLDRRFKQQLLKQSVQPLSQNTDQVAIHPGEQACGHLHQGDLGPQGRIDRSDFKPDVTAADHEQFFRHGFELECSGGVHETIGIHVPNGQGAGMGTGGDDGVFKRQLAGRTAGFLDRQRSVILESGGGLTILNATLLDQLPQSPRQLGHDVIFPAAQFGGLNLGTAENDATVLGRARFDDLCGDMEQCLRRNTPPVKANAARIRFGVDQRYLQSEIGRQKSGGITPRARSDNGHLRVHLCHSVSSLLRQQFSLNI